MTFTTNAKLTMFGSKVLFDVEQLLYKTELIDFFDCVGIL